MVFYGKNLIFYILYWIFYLLFFSFQRSAAQHFFFAVGGLNLNYLESLRISFLSNLAFLPGVIIVTHFAVNIILPEFYFKNKFFLFSVILILTIFIYPVIPFLIRTYVVEPYIFNDPNDYDLYNYFAAILIFV